MKGNLESSKFSKGNAPPAKKCIHQFSGILSFTYTFNSNRVRDKIKLQVRVGGLLPGDGFYTINVASRVQFDNFTTLTETSKTYMYSIDVKCNYQC